MSRGLTPPQAVWTIDLVTLAGGLGALLLHRLDGWGACVVVAQTCCLLGVVAILELSASRSEQANGQTRRETVGTAAAEAVQQAGRDNRRRQPGQLTATTGIAGKRRPKRASGCAGWLWA